MDGHAALLELSGVLVGEGQNPNAIASVLQRGEQVTPEEAVAPCDQDVRTASPFCSVGDQCLRRYATSARLGAACSSQAMA
jgi:hypothetical protein